MDSVAPPQQQRCEIAVLLATSVSVLPKQWWSRWKRYTEPANETGAAHALESPGPLSNATLMDEGGTQLRTNLVEDVHFVIVPTAVTDRLLEWYGGEKPLTTKQLEPIFGPPALLHKERECTLVAAVPGIHPPAAVTTVPNPAIPTPPASTEFLAVHSVRRTRRPKARSKPEPQHSHNDPDSERGENSAAAHPRLPPPTAPPSNPPAPESAWDDGIAAELGWLRLRLVTPSHKVLSLDAHPHDTVEHLKFQACIALCMHPEEYFLMAKKVYDPVVMWEPLERSCGSTSSLNEAGVDDSTMLQLTRNSEVTDLAPPAELIPSLNLPYVEPLPDIAQCVEQCPVSFSKFKQRDEKGAQPRSEDGMCTQGAQ
eukprot:TRINITY_DN5169_c0_g1_i1.p1 TRINITY_DN5169_c0_g1~~TRINITY_DN5169_c0_g1_i1.p1  ORF type:complete len:369 (-),score=75.49 TRINITY_DN5169_c0_g1_i1:96-1202(-)